MCTITLVVVIFWSFIGGYKTITQPIYEERIIENVQIPELETKKNESGKYDIVYVNKDKKEVYIDNKAYEKGIVTVCNSKQLKFEVYKCVPRNTFLTSVNLFFNKKIIYKVYVPKDYTIITQLKMK